MRTLSLAALIVLVGCSHRATQLMVVVDTDLDPTSYDCISGEVTRVVDGVASTPSQFRVLVTPSDARGPFSFGVVPPDGDPSAFVQVSVEARVGACEDPNVMPPTAPGLVRTAVRASFRSEETLRLPMFLASACRGVVCPEDSTCDPATGACAAIPSRPGTDLTPVRPGEELLDAGVMATDAQPQPDAGEQDGGVICFVDGDDRPFATTPPFALTSTQASREWAVLYSDGTALHTYRYPLTSGFVSTDTTWAPGGADAIALEGLPASDDLIAVVNPEGSTDLVRYVGPATGTGTQSALGLAPGTLLDGGRHSALLGAMLVTVVARGAAYDVIGVGVASEITIHSGTLPTDLALGSTATGNLLVALGTTGDPSCTVHEFDAAGGMVATTTLSPLGAGSCRPRGLQRLTDGRNALLFADDDALYLQVFVAGSQTEPTYFGIRRRDMATAIPTAAGVLGNSAQFRAVWAETNAVYSQNNFDDVTRIHQFASGGFPAIYAGTRWEGNGEQSAYVIPRATGLAFSTWLCP